MLTIIIAVTIGVITATSCQNFTEMGMFWSVTIGVLVTLAIQVSVSLFLRKKINAATLQIQGAVLAGQERIRKKMNMFQQKPVGGMKTMQAALEKEQTKSIEEALALTSILEPFCKWTPLLEKQISTMRFQFNYQLKNYEKADEFMKKAFFMDPMSLAMKLARMYKNDDPALEKAFKKAVKKFSGEKSVILYAVYSWILVKQDKVDEAIVLLSKAKDDTGNEILQRNWEALANGKIKKFSNAGIGDEWFALYLEEPKMPKTKMKQPKRGKTPF